MSRFILGLVMFLPFVGFAAGKDEAAALRSYLRSSYPSLAYVERYRIAFPEEVQGTNFNIVVSESFAIFDPRGELTAGEASETELIDKVTADRFEPSRSRPFAIQAVGMRPDVESKSSLADLVDGGKAQILRAISTLRERRMVK